MSDEPWVGLPEAIATIRAALSEAMRRGRDQEPRLEAKEITMEFAVELRRQHGVEGGVQAWVLRAGGAWERGRADIHRLTITLAPTTADGGPVRVESSTGLAEPYRE